MNIDNLISIRNISYLVYMENLVSVRNRDIESGNRSKLRVVYLFTFEPTQQDNLPSNTKFTRRKLHKKTRDLIFFL